jgi:hypothetical protein
MLLVGAGVGVCVPVVAALWLMRRSRKKHAVEVRKSQPALPAAPSAVTGGGALAEREGAAATLSKPQFGGELIAPRTMQVPQLLSPRHDMLVREVQEIVKKDSELSAGIVHGWLVEETQQ